MIITNTRPEHVTIDAIDTDDLVLVGDALYEPSFCEDDYIDSLLEHIKNQTIDTAEVYFDEEYNDNRFAYWLDSDKKNGVELSIDWDSLTGDWDDIIEQDPEIEKQKDDALADIKDLSAQYQLLTLLRDYLQHLTFYLPSLWRMSSLGTYNNI